MQGVRGIYVALASLLYDGFSVFLDILRRPEDGPFLHSPRCAWLGGMNLSLQPASYCQCYCSSDTSSGLQVLVVFDVSLLRDLTL